MDLTLPACRIAHLSETGAAPCEGSATIALSTMISNNLVMPMLLRIPSLRLDQRSDLSTWLVAVRHAAIEIVEPDANGALVTRRGWTVCIWRRTSDGWKCVVDVFGYAE